MALYLPLPVEHIFCAPTAAVGDGNGLRARSLPDDPPNPDIAFPSTGVNYLDLHFSQVQTRLDKGSLLATTSSCSVQGDSLQC